MGKKQKTHAKNACALHRAHTQPVARSEANVMHWTIPHSFLLSLVIFPLSNRNERMNNKETRALVFLASSDFIFCIFHNSTYCVFYTVELWLFDCEISANLFFKFFVRFAFVVVFWFAIIIWMPIDCTCSVWYARGLIASLFQFSMFFNDNEQFQNNI